MKQPGWKWLLIALLLGLVTGDFVAEPSAQKAGKEASDHVRVQTVPGPERN
jgi:hypothetical protein